MAKRVTPGKKIAEAENGDEDMMWKVMFKESIPHKKYSYVSACEVYDNGQSVAFTGKDGHPARAVFFIEHIVGYWNTEHLDEAR